MRLTHLEILGFKSFPERAGLAFDDGVTAIVGPNGCGKSNVIDAITWVLGEQSARSLRGERMEDVIFSGSDARRPTAAAEVRLQLSQVAAAPSSVRGRGGGNGHADGNSRGPGGNGRGHGALVVDGDATSDNEFDEPPTITCDVEVGRRLYRSGESEYLLDGQVCRLRDIQDLLMDSGVGVKAYAVIEQGKIGQILSARPAERRQLLEEAAGVTKYKTRRRSAELKLEAAQQNSTRVDDIVFEVEKQRGALKRQAAKARRYRRLREELRRWEKVRFAQRSQTLTRAIEAAVLRLEEALIRERGAAAGLAGLESIQESLRINLVDADRAATSTRDAIHQQELEVGRRQQQIEFDKQHVSALAAALTEGEVELCALEQCRAPAEGELSAQQAARERCTADCDAAASRSQAAERALTDAQRAIEGLEADVEAARSEVFAAVNAATALQNVMDNTAVARGRLTEELTKLEVEMADVSAERARIVDARECVDQEARRTRENLEAAKASRADHDAELASARVEREWRAREVRTREYEMASMRARLDSLEEFEASRAAYGDAARVVLAASGKHVDHLGSVADYVEVRRSDERAVEACLGDLLECIVVRSYEDALAGMALAKRKNAGRCGFVIIDGHRQPSAEAQLPHASLRSLGQIAQVNGPGARVVRSLLARRWLAPSLEQAAAAARVTDDQITTPEGFVFRGPSLVNGGGQRRAHGILSTKGEVKALRARLVSEEEEVQRLNAEIVTFAGRVAHAEVALTALHTGEHTHEKALVGLDLQHANLDDELERLARKQEVIDTEHRKADAECEGMDAKQTEARKSIARLEAEQNSANERFMSTQRHLLQTRESVDGLGRQFTEAKAAHAALAERSAALAADVRRLVDQTSDLDQRIRWRADANQHTVADREARFAAVALSEHQLDEGVKAFELLREEVRSVDERTTDLQQQIADHEAKVREARRALDEVRAEVGRLDVARATVDSDLSHLSASCTDTLQLTLDEVCADVDQLELEGTIAPDASLIGHGTDGADDTGVIDEDSAVADTSVSPVEATPETSTKLSDADGLGVEGVIDRLRERIDRLGPVNMMAIDQFDELEQRHEFLTTQRRDLLGAIAATGEAIKRIDVTTRTRFREAFTAVSEYFQATFETLFGGGRAGLVLLDESDVLESGIDIIAQPPGKRLQSIQLLSGGEKALTAMALMFAIFKYRPSPFCLLDEIDAPLDDANIGRFVEMLRGLHDDTQFVLVTHNRKTMEIADQLYGVTMEEPGVSKLISVKLN